MTRGALTHPTRRAPTVRDSQPRSPARNRLRTKRQRRQALAPLAALGGRRPSRPLPLLRCRIPPRRRTARPARPRAPTPRSPGSLGPRHAACGRRGPCLSLSLSGLPRRRDGRALRGAPTSAVLRPGDRPRARPLRPAGRERRRGAGADQHLVHRRSHRRRRLEHPAPLDRRRATRRPLPLSAPPTRHLEPPQGRPERRPAADELRTRGGAPGAPSVRRAAPGRALHRPLATRPTRDLPRGPRASARSRSGRSSRVRAAARSGSPRGW